MIQINGSACYDTPAGTIFAILTDPFCYPAWQPDVESATVAADGPVRQGARIRQVRTVMGRRTDIDLTMTHLVPVDLVALATAAGAQPAVRQSWRLRPDGGGCRLEYRLTLDGMPKMAESLARAQLTRQIPQMLGRLAASPPSRPTGGGPRHEKGDRHERNALADPAAAGGRRGHAYHVLLDGERVGTVRNHSSTEVPVEAGEHTLQINTPNIVTRKPGRGSQVMTFEVDDGDVAEFTCRSPKYPGALYWYLVCVFGDSDRWIELEQVK